MALPILLPANVQAYRGDALSFEIRVRSDRKLQTPVDLTTYGTAWASQLRTDPYADLVAATFIIDTTQAHVGQLVLSLTSSTVLGLAAPLYYFDVQVTGGAQSPLTVFRGRMSIEEDVTRA